MDSYGLLELLDTMLNHLNMAFGTFQKWSGPPIDPILRQALCLLRGFQMVPMDFSHVKTIPKGDKSSLGWIAQWVKWE